MKHTFTPIDQFPGIFYTKTLLICIYGPARRQANI